MSSEAIAIRVHGVSKHYLLFERPQDRLKQMIVPRLQRLARRPPTRYFRDFAALSNVSFEVKRGETVGIVGRNGSGKSTLLQVVCGTLSPTHGSVVVHGRIAALLELGAGFNPEFTGRENVYLNGAILGLSSGEIDAQFDAIAQFADIGDFIDQPVKTYSSGMYVRLAFATAINVDPDILVVDEALAVGDEAFQRKCYARIEEIQSKGGTILFVSHGAQAVVQLCSRALLFDAGELVLDGRPKMVVNQYQRLVNANKEQAAVLRAEIHALGRGSVASSAPATFGRVSAPRNGALASVSGRAEATAGSFVSYDPNLVPQSTVHLEQRGVHIRDARILTLKGEQVNVLQLTRRYMYEYFADFEADATEVGFGMFVRTTEGIGLAGAQTVFSRTQRTKQIARGVTAHVQFEFTCAFLPGTYFMNCGIYGTLLDEQILMHRIIDCTMFRVAPEADLIATGRFDLGIVPKLRFDHKGA